MARTDGQDKRMLEEFPELEEALEKEWQQRNMAEDGCKTIGDLRLRMTRIKQMQVITGVILLCSAIWLTKGFIGGP